MNVIIKHIVGIVIILNGLCACSLFASDRLFQVNRSPSFIKKRIELQEDRIDRKSMNLDQVHQLAHGNILTYTPLEVTQFDQRAGLQQLAGKIGQSVRVRQAGENILKRFEAKQQINSIKSINLRGVYTYKDMASVIIHFPNVPTSQLSKHAKENQGAIDLNTWQLNYSLVFSRNRKAVRFIINRFEILDIRKEKDPQTLVEAVPILVLLTYRHPDHQSGSINIKAVVFDYLARPDHGKFIGQRQGSDWVPLAIDAAEGPYSIDISIVEVSKDFMKIYKTIGDFVLSARKFL